MAYSLLMSESRQTRVCFNEGEWSCFAAVTRPCVHYSDSQRVNPNGCPLCHSHTRGVIRHLPMETSERRMAFLHSPRVPLSAGILALRGPRLEKGEGREAVCLNVCFDCLLNLSGADASFPPQGWPEWVPEAAGEALLLKCRMPGDTWPPGMVLSKSPQRVYALLCPQREWVCDAPSHKLLGTSGQTLKSSVRTEEMVELSLPARNPLPGLLAL